MSLQQLLQLYFNCLRNELASTLRNKAVSTSVPVSSGCERTFRVVFVMAYRSTVNYFLSETINRIRHPLFPSYTTNDYSSWITDRLLSRPPQIRACTVT